MSDRRHPELFTTEEACDYLAVKCLDPLRDKWGLRPLPLGQGLYHKLDLDAVVEKARTGKNPTPRTR